ncbi:GtrA family protein [Enterocloster clostridioformis]|uniref:GtrA family protein n=1 Tax=Enterocloster clostridioformis TaxID=1531 RepID=UPI0026746F92|nr:GtrA family protein [Enterocloster clostridioformis]
MSIVRAWIKGHPNLWEFILFNVLSNVATVTNFVVMWVCTGFVFRTLSQTPFQFLIFNYTNTASDLGLCGFLSFLAATACAQTVNFFVQKNFVFKSNAAFSQAVPKYIGLAVLLVVVSAALPAYSQTLLVNLGFHKGIAPTLANLVNIIVQVVISYPAMKFWIMPKHA